MIGRDEHNRLTQVKAADETVLANYAYDALGRRIAFEDPVAGTTTRYYYDGQRVIEERDETDALLRCKPPTNPVLSALLPVR